MKEPKVVGWCSDVVSEKHQHVGLELLWPYGLHFKVKVSEPLVGTGSWRLRTDCT